MTTSTEIDARTVELTMSEAINRALDEALASGEPVMHLGQDIGPHGGTGRGPLLLIGGSAWKTTSF